MSLSSTTSRVSYAGNGVTTAFSFPYYFLADADLVVILRVNSTGVETTKTITTHYTVSGSGNPAGGTVTMLTAPANGETLVIYRDPAVTQGVDLAENDSLPAETVEQALDRAAMISQRLDDRLDRATRLTDGYSGSFDPKLPATFTADAVLKVNSGGTAFEMGPTATDISNAATNAATASAAASSASSSASAAAASAASAASAVNSAAFRDVVYKVFGDSPITVSSTDNGKILACDTSGGAIVINLPAISSITPPFNVTVLLEAGSNSVTINRNGTDTINGNTAFVLRRIGEGVHLLGDADASPDRWAALPYSRSSLGQSDGVHNLGLATSVGSNALTIALKDRFGSDPSASSPVMIGFRNATAGTGTYNEREITAAASLVISSGSTLGHTSAVDGYIYVYAIDNSGTIEIAASSQLYDDGSIVTTTAEGGAGGADSATVIYSTTARSNVPLRLIGRLKSNQTTAGTWAANMTEISLGRFFKAKAPTIQKFTSGSGTYTTPAGVAYIRVRMVGGGGGGGGGGTSGATAGGSGGNTTFGTSLLTASGGSGGSVGSSGGSGGSATVNSPAIGAGVSGGGGGACLNANGTNVYLSSGVGGASALGGAGHGAAAGAAGGAGATNSGGGGGGGGGSGGAGGTGGAGGGAGAFIDAIISAPSLASSYAYAVGSGGNAGGAGSSGGAGGLGGSGYVEVTEYYYQ